MENDRKRPLDEQSAGKQIKLSIKGQDGVTVFFVTNRDTPVLKVLQAFCRKRNLEYKAIRFIYNGQRLSSRQTPESLGMVDDDEIDALMHQGGGGFTGGSAHLDA